MENQQQQIYKSLCAITKEIGAIGKDRRNPQQGFMFRGIDQVMNTLHPLLAEYGVFIVPEIIESRREERQTKSGGNLIYTIHKVRYHFTAMDGSEVCATVIGEGMDSADKSSNKAMAVAFKYACFQVFCIPTEEVREADPDGYTPEESRPTAEQLRDYIDHCDTLEDFRTLQQAWGSYIKADQQLAAYANGRFAEIKRGGKP